MSIQVQSTDSSLDFVRMIEQSVKIKVNELVEQAIKEAQEEVKRALYAQVDNIALEVLHTYEIHMLRDRVVIEVKKGKSDE